MHRLASAILFLALSAVPLKAETVTHAFEMSISGLGVARVVLTINRNGQDYTADVRVRGRGLVGAIVDLGYDGMSHGRITGDGMPRPELFRGARTDDDDGGRTTLVRFSADRPVSVTADPPYPPRPWDVELSALGGALDPVAAGVAFIDDRPVGQACGRSADIYDGRHLARLTIGPRRLSDNRWTCAGVYRRVGGYSPKKMAEQVEFPFVITYHEIDGILRVARIDMESTFGTARLQRR